MCQFNDPIAIVELKQKNINPDFSKKNKLKFFNNLKSDNPPDLSIIKPNQENIKALLQQTKINKNRASFCKFKLKAKIT